MNTILLVEDNANQQLLYQIELEEEGYRVVIAENGPDALCKIRCEKPDLVVVDLSMGGMDGLQTLDRFIYKHHRPIVVIHSAFDLRQNNALTRLSDAYVLKRSNLDPLKKRIRQLLSRSKNPQKSLPEGAIA